MMKSSKLPSVSTPNWDIVVAQLREGYHHARFKARDHEELTSLFMLYETRDSLLPEQQAHIHRRLRLLYLVLSYGWGVAMSDLEFHKTQAANIVVDPEILLQHIERRRELGLLEKYSKSASGGNTHKEQVFDYLLVLDFEATCWENSRRRPAMEIIEFPVVLLDLKSGKILDEFRSFVQPFEHPILSNFCTSLTGITQPEVESGPPLGACLVAFNRWLQKAQKKFGFTVASSDTASGKLAAFATWSDWDLGVCLKNECRRKDLIRARYFDYWIDVKATYTRFYQRQPHGLHGALQSQGLRFKGRQHSGICDARNTAALLHRMAQDGCVIQLTKNPPPPPKGVPWGRRNR